MAELDGPQWQRLNRLLELALELDAGARETWLNGLEDEAPEVLAVLRQLLAEQQQDAPGMTLTSGNTLARLMLAALPSGDSAGDLVGPYRLLHLLGQGGMSTVWAAERADGGVQRRVALKIPHAEWSDRGLAERLSRECKVLAELNHPHIAHLYDAGTASNGRPYLALELVAGQQIDHSCASQGLDTRARVRLFTDVLQAVAYAHARLVVHRDLKPANVLVTPQGQVKLLDFGIAKMLSSDTASAEETELTRLSGRPLTLAYAAPEQVLGGSVTTATDIYALGAVLYELLSGARACRPRNDTRAALEEAIVAGRPALPSSVASDPAAARALRGDLDAILLKALSTAPEHRYATAAAFADDLERYLDGRAVRARLSSQRYRVERFLARNRLMVATAAAISMALVSGLGIALWQAHEAARQAGIAASERDRALAALEYRDAVDGFLSDLLQEAGRAGKPVSIPELIDRADAMSAREFADAPEPRAAVLKTVGDFKVNAEGIASATRYFDRAMQLIANSQDAGLRSSIACSRHLLHGVAGSSEDAGSAMAAITRIANDPASPAHVVSECLGDLAQIALFEFDGKTAARASEQALQVWTGSARKSPTQHVVLLLLAADAQVAVGQLGKAEIAYRQSLSELKRLGRDRGDWGMRARFGLIESAKSSCDTLNALALVDEAIEFARSDLSGAVPPNALFDARAKVLNYLGRYEEALDAYRRLALDTAVSDPALHQRALLGAAMAASSLGRTAEADQAYDEAQALQPGDAFTSLRARAQLELDRHDFAHARESSSAGLQISSLPNEARALLFRLRARAELGNGLGREALADARQAMAMDLELRGDKPYSQCVGESAQLVASAQELLGQGEQAHQNFATAAAQLAGSLGPDHVWARIARERVGHDPGPETTGLSPPRPSPTKDAQS